MEKHVCTVPSSGAPGDIWECPTCKRVWRATSDISGGSFIWWVTTDLEARN